MVRLLYDLGLGIMGSLHLCGKTDFITIVRIIHNFIVFKHEPRRSWG